MTKRLLTLAAATVLGVSLLSACQGGDGSAYCDRVRDNAKSNTLDKLDPSKPADLQTFIAEAKKLQADAPDEIKDDYDAVLQAFQNPTGASSKVTAAIGNIQKYDEDNCDVKYDNGS